MYVELEQAFVDLLGASSSDYGNFQVTRLIVITAFTVYPGITITCCFSSPSGIVQGSRDKMSTKLSFESLELLVSYLVLLLPSFTLVSRPIFTSSNPGESGFQNRGLILEPKLRT